jgi:hypothetical protein
MRALFLTLMTPAICIAQGPALTVDQAHFNFGRINGDARAFHRFKVTNTGNAQLNISRINPSCGCTSTVIGQWTLNPGQSTEIEATFNPAGFRGVVHKSIQVVCNDPANPTLNLTFEAEVVRDIMPSTDSVFFQDLVRNTVRKTSVKLASGNGEPVRPVRAEAPGSPYLAATFRPEGKDAWVDIALDGRKVPAGVMVGADALVVHTGNPKMPMITLTVQWEVRAAVVAEPVRATFVDNAGKEHRQTIVLKQVDGKPFRILSAKATNPLLWVDGLGRAAASQQSIQVVMTSKAKAGNYNEKILLTTDLPDQPEMELRVAAALR